jgi:hypothetical protein
MSAIPRFADSTRTSPEVREGPILLKKSEYPLDQIFSAPWVRFSDAEVGDLTIHF